LIIFQPPRGLKRFYIHVWGVIHQESTCLHDANLLDGFDPTTTKAAGQLAGKDLCFSDQRAPNFHAPRVVRANVASGSSRSELSEVSALRSFDWSSARSAP